MIIQHVNNDECLKIMLKIKILNSLMIINLQVIINNAFCILKKSVK